MAAPYPSQVMFEALKAFSRISNKDAALMLIKEDFSMGGRTLHDRIISDRTYVSRYVANAEPGTLPPNCFQDFGQVAQAIAGRTLKAAAAQDKSQDAATTAIGYYSGPVAKAMAGALEAVGESPHLYTNMVANILKRKDISAPDMLSLLVMLFIAAGSLGKSAEAVQTVEAFSKNMLASGFHTEATTMTTTELAAEDAVAGNASRLGLMRKSGDFARMHLYELSNAPSGTIIGRNPSQEPSIDDVDDIVSAEHLRIWLSPEGKWLAEGMNSTNGTVLISGEDKHETFVEPPRKKRDGWVSAPVEILPGDVLRLAGVTEFLVITP